MDLVSNVSFKNYCVETISGWLELALEGSFICHKFDDWVVKLHVQNHLSCIAVELMKGISFLFFINLEVTLSLRLSKSKVPFVVHDRFDGHMIFLKVLFGVSFPIVNLEF